MTNIGKVKSLTGSKWYDITYSKTTRKYKCTCLAKAFNKDQDCKHVKQLKSGEYPYGKMKITEEGKKILAGKDKPKHKYILHTYIYGRDYYYDGSPDPTYWGGSFGAKKIASLSRAKAIKAALLLLNGSDFAEDIIIEKAS